MGKRKRILTGDRPTGNLHLGHYVGSIKNRVEFQDSYDEYVMIADIQALTDNFDHPEKVRENTLQVLLDNLACGLDPDKVTFFLQSAIPEIAELTVFFANLVTVARLERNPTVKDEIQQRGFVKSLPLGFFMYPVSQAADILIVKGEVVPVGEDQVPHVEQTREIARKFNSIYGRAKLDKPIFSLPEARMGTGARLVGTDGQAKMSKSLGNVIFLKDDPDTVKKRVASMYTDPKRIHPTDPGTVEGNPVFIYHDFFNPDANEVNDLKDRYRQGKVGDVEVKDKLTAAINQFLEPIQARRKEFDDPDRLHEILATGTRKAKKMAEQTMAEVRAALRLYDLTAS